MQDWFGHFWERSAPFPLADLYASRWDPHSPWLVFLRMLWELYGRDLKADDRTAQADDLRLTAFQRDGVFRALRLLQANGGVLVADEVGLGKTFIAAEMIRRAADENRQRVLVLAPAALKESMWERFLDSRGFSRRVQCMSYDELRVSWQRDEEDTRRRLDDYALVIVDEAHNLRNPQAQRTETVAALVGGEHPKQVVLLTATPVNNSLGDLHALVSLFIHNDGFFAHAGIPSIRLDALAGGWVLTGDALRDWIASDAEDLEEHVAWLDDRSKSAAAEASEYWADALAADVRADLALLERLRALAEAAADQAREPKSERLVSRLPRQQARRVTRPRTAPAPQAGPGRRRGRHGRRPARSRLRHRPGIQRHGAAPDHGDPRRGRRLAFSATSAFWRSAGNCRPD